MNKISKLSKFFSTKNQAIIALGSNMGNRFQNISKATEYLRKYNNVIKTSQIYENPCLDNSNNVLGNESNFFNAAVQIETTLSCQDLLQYCKTIERELGRIEQKKNENEARTIDLDILFYNDLNLNSNLLQVPHPRLEKRAFVLKPVLDIILTNKTINKNFISLDVVDRLKKLVGSNIYNDCLPNLNKIVYFRHKNRYLDLSTKKHLVKSIYCTKNKPTQRGIYTTHNLLRENDHARVLNHIAEHYSDVEIIEICGENDTYYNTNAIVYPEILRITSMMDSIKRSQALKDKIVCVRTKNSKTAEEAIKNGVDMIFDDSSFTVDSKIANLVADANIPIIIAYNHASSPNHSIQQLVRNETSNLSFQEGLRKRINNLCHKNINNWNIVVDFGLRTCSQKDRKTKLNHLPSLKESIENPILVDDIVSKEEKSLRNNINVSFIRSPNINDEVEQKAKNFS